MLDIKAVFYLALCIIGGVIVYQTDGAVSSGIIAGIVLYLILIVVDGLIVEPIIKANKTPKSGNSSTSGSTGGSITGRKIYSGYSYDVAYRIDGDKIYSGYSYDVAFRIDT